MKVKGNLKFFLVGGVKKNMLLTNLIAEFLKQQYLKNDETKQPIILHVDRGSRKLNGGLKKFGKV